MKVAIVVFALISSAVASQGYGTVIDQPDTFDRLDDGYPNPEKLAVIKNFGVGLAVPHRETKFSPVIYDHGGNTNDVNPHGGNTHDVNPHGGNTHDVNPHGGNTGNNNVGYGNQFNVGFGQGKFNNQLNQGKVFSRDPHGFFPGKPIKPDPRLHRVSKPTLPSTGHQLNTGLVKIGVPLASKPIHTPLKGYQSHPPIKRIPLRKIDLGAHATDIKTDNKGYGLDIQIPHDNILNKPVHQPPLQFPVVSVPEKDSFRGDSFFNGKLDGNIGLQKGQGGGYGNADAGSQGGYA